MVEASEATLPRDRPRYAMGVGMPAELLLERRQDALLFCTFVRHANLIARAVWAGVEPVHRPVVRHVLEDAARRIGEMERGA